MHQYETQRILPILILSTAIIIGSNYFAPSVYSQDPEESVSSEIAQRQEDAIMN